MKLQYTRREFTRAVAAGTLATGFAPNLFSAPDPDRFINLGFIGVGGRGTGLLRSVLEFEGVLVPAICDVLDKNLNRAQDFVERSGRPRPQGYSRGPEDYKRMLERDDLDGIIIATPWRWHIPMSIAAMNAGKYVGCEVGPASSLQECHDLVEAHEQTGVPCMLLENSCYRRNMMAILYMVRLGLLGELIQCHGGYMHDLRERIVTGKGTGVTLPGGGDYRSRQNRLRNGDIYPTHGLGPLAKFLDINCGNRFVSISSFATKSRGLKKWTVDNLGDDHPYADIDWAMGDLVTSIIQCQNGENIVLHHDCALPRPKTFMWQVQGTKGIYSEDADSIHIDGVSPGHKWEPFEHYQEKYDHPVWRDYLKLGVRGGHDGSDFLELNDFIDCVRKQHPVPIDVYDMAAWMAVSPLSEQSIRMGGKPVSFPDFTNGNWMTRKPFFGIV